MKRRLAMTACLAVLCAGILFAAAEVFHRNASEAYTDPDTGLVFSSESGSFRKTMVRRNLNPVFGTVIRYENENGSCADVYVYSLDTAAKAVTPEQLKTHFGEVASEILGLPKSGKGISKVEKITRTDKLPSSVLADDFRITVRSEEILSALSMFLYKGKIIKLRISCAPDSAEEQAESRAFEKNVLIQTGLIEPPKDE